MGKTFKLKVKPSSNILKEKGAAPSLQIHQIQFYANMRHSLLLTFFLLLLTSCQNYNETNISNIINLAGSNNKELKKVIDHYNGTDFLGYKSALFLLKNLPYKYSYSDLQIDSLLKLKKESIQKGKICDSIIEKWASFDYRRTSKKQDINNITADILIENIDYALKAWNRHKWSKHYTFEDFCEYVLPYRVGDEPLEKWRKMYYEKYNPILDSLYKGDDAVEAARILANYLKQEGFTNRTDFSLPHLGASFLFHNRVGYCRENCDIALYAMRSVGIPVATDFYNISPSYDSRHFWTSVIDTNHRPIPFNYVEEEISRTRKEERKKGKVYRYCFNKQEKNANMAKEAGDIFTNPFIKDVTETYFPHSRVLICLQEGEPNMYLSVFSKGQYTPIDIAKRKGYTYCFRGIEQNLVYFPTWIRNGSMQCATHPFLLSNNIPHFFAPNMSLRTRICLKRKYPLLKGRDFVKNIYGAKIEASNNKDFKHSTILYEFKTLPNTNRLVISPKTSKPYRYIRFTAHPKKKIELGEFYIYKRNGKHIAFPIEITSSEPLDSILVQNLSLLTDKQWDSFYMSKTPGASLTFDYGKPIFPKQIIVIPRNDDNYIHLGDTYELFFHQGEKEWKSLGIQKATSNSLHFNAVPFNALLWLHNHSRGSEERPFYMKNGRQIFP